ncbi:MAG: hypothetical protein N2595_03735 [bacterium]|nr:hypothetical protein [bacterium]
MLKSIAKWRKAVLNGSGEECGGKGTKREAAGGAGMRVACLTGGQGFSIMGA